MKVYTTGYSDKKPEDLKALAESMDAILCDIRLMPRSRWAKHWNKGALSCC